MSDHLALTLGLELTPSCFKAKYAFKNQKHNCTQKPQKGL